MSDCVKVQIENHGLLDPNRKDAGIPSILYSAKATDATKQADSQSSKTNQV